jgi:hypothetical protein
MDYYKYRPDANHFAGVCVASGHDVDIADIHYDDSFLASGWSPIKFDGFDDNPEQVGDFPSLSNYHRVPIFSQRAWRCLAPLIGGACEPLPVICPFNGPYFLVHVYETVDCLVENCSEVDRSVVDDRIDRVFKYCLDLQKLQGKHIFKLPFKSGRELLVDDVFRAAVEDNLLKGLVFRDLRWCPSPVGLDNRGGGEENTLE